MAHTWQGYDHLVMVTQVLSMAFHMMPKGGTNA